MLGKFEWPSSGSWGKTKNIKDLCRSTKVFTMTAKSVNLSSFHFFHSFSQFLLDIEVCKNIAYFLPNLGEFFVTSVTKPILKVMKSQNEYMKSSHCPKYKQDIKEISALEDYID